MPFSNPIIGGSGSLVYPAIKSPNFDQATLTGWAIQKNGSAYFYDVTVSGQYVGSNFIINALGAFFYNVNVGQAISGTNELSYSIVPGNSSVTDPFGNECLSGTTEYIYAGAGVGYYAFQNYAAVNNIYFNTTSMASWGSNTPWTNVDISSSGGIITALAQIFYASVAANSVILNTNRANAPTPVEGYVDYASSTGVPATITQNGATGYRPFVITDTGTYTLGNTTSGTALSVGYAAVANDGVENTTYELECALNGTYEGKTLHLGLMLNGTYTDVVPAAPTFTSGDNIVGTFRIRVRVITVGTSGTINIEGDGELQDGTATRTQSTGMPLCGFRTAIAYNTTVTNTLAIGGAWSATATGETVSGIGSTFTRSGP